MVHTVNDKILVNGGEVFEGSWEQLDDCFGIQNVNDLNDWCQLHGFTYVVVEEHTMNTHQRIVANLKEHACKYVNPFVALKGIEDPVAGLGALEELVQQGIIDRQYFSVHGAPGGTSRAPLYMYSTVKDLMRELTLKVVD